MKTRISFALRIAGAIVCLGATGLIHAEDVSHYTFGNTEQWYIYSPVVNSPAWRNFSGQISFRAGDTVVITAGGCVQTGGHGLTWKRYVAPQGPNSDRLYFGVFAMPGVPVTAFRNVLQPVSPGSDVWQGTFYVDTYEAPPYDTLWLAYPDDGYSDNGYYSHDNGTGDQCRNVGNAWITLNIVHRY
jgi:hypothetical protein